MTAPQVRRGGGRGRGHCP